MNEGGATMPEGRRMISFRSTQETGRLLDVLSRRLGLSRAGVFALALREMAERRGIEVRDDDQGGERRAAASDDAERVA
jgi:hypothetical protein